MRSALRGLAIGVFLLALAGAIASRLGWIVAAPPRADGAGPWLVSRATGLAAYVALATDVIAGLLVSTRRGDRLVARGQLVDLHGWLSPLALGLVVAHAVVLLADRYAQLDVIDLVVPFAAERWRFALGLGVLGAYLAALVHASFGWRKRLGTTTWRRLHYLSFVAFVLVTIHAIAVGTDRGSAWFVTVYVALLGAVAALLAVRVRPARAT